MSDDGARWSKNLQISVTSFMDDPVKEKMYKNKLNLVSPIHKREKNVFYIVWTVDQQQQRRRKRQHQQQQEFDFEPQQEIS